MKLTLLPLIGLLISVIATQAQVDVAHYHIQIKVDKPTKTLGGFCDLSLKQSEDWTTLNLDLQGPKVDSIVHLPSGEKGSFTTNNNVVTAVFQQTFTKDELVDVRVYYGGVPGKDPSWGGFYFNGEYAYNMGVGIGSDPHPFGRTWFPCNDKFTDKATFSFSIEVDSIDRAMCNGVLDSVSQQGDKKVFHWSFNKEIPTYLASVAIAPYEVIEWNLFDTHFTLAALQEDTLNMRKSFKRLVPCFQAFEESFGPHPFDRVGFNAVPFHAGAMEHATNIAFPQYGVENGDTNYETLYAHEFAHHWWGDNITCSEAAQMWINEGWASWAEALFVERMYGKARANAYVQDNHKQVLHFAHLADGEVLPVSGVATDQTYSMHVYSKGADVIHTLRYLMGDKAFFAAIKNLMGSYKYQNVTNHILLEEFNKESDIDLTSFFEQWIETSGFVAFSPLAIDLKKENESWKVSGVIRQHQKFSQIVYKDIKLPIRVYGQTDSTDLDIPIKGQDQAFEFLIDFEPLWVAFDPDQKFNDAVTDYQTQLEVDELFSFPNTYCSVQNTQNNKSTVQVRHYWVGADGYFNNNAGVAISTQRFWEIRGDKNLEVSATFEYNGRAPLSGFDGFLDNELIHQREDSLVLLYRPHALANWEILPQAQRAGGSAFDKRGEISISSAKVGQYALGIYDYELVSVGNKTKVEGSELKLAPNPSDQQCVLNWTNRVNDSAQLEITNSLGQVIQQLRVAPGTNSLTIDVSEFSNGIYYVGLVTDGTSYNSVRMVVKHK